MKKLLAAALAMTALSTWADDAALIAETKKTALGIPPKLLQMVQDEIDKGSYHGAIAACSEKAPKMAAAASQSTGWAIRRPCGRGHIPTPDGAVRWANTI